MGGLCGWDPRLPAVEWLCGITSIPVHEVSRTGLIIHMKALFLDLKELCG